MALHTSSVSTEACNTPCQVCAVSMVSAVLVTSNSNSVSSYSDETWPVRTGICEPQCEAQWRHVSCQAWHDVCETSQDVCQQSLHSHSTRRCHESRVCLSLGTSYARLSTHISDSSLCSSVALCVSSVKFPSHCVDAAHSWTQLSEGKRTLLSRRHCHNHSPCVTVAYLRHNYTHSSRMTSVWHQMCATCRPRLTTLNWGGCSFRHSTRQRGRGGGQLFRCSFPRPHNGIAGLKGDMLGQSCGTTCWSHITVSGWGSGDSVNGGTWQMLSVYFLTGKLLVILVLFMDIK